MQPANLTLSGDNQQLITGRGSIMFIDLSETSGSAAGLVTLWDGVNAKGQSLGYYNILEGDTQIVALPRHGLMYEQGVWVDVNSTAVAGLISVVQCDSEADWAALISYLNS